MYYFPEWLKAKSETAACITETRASFIFLEDDRFFAMYAVVSWEAMVVGMQLLKYNLLQFNKLEIAFLTLADIAWEVCHLFIPSGAEQ